MNGSVVVYEGEENTGIFESGGRMMMEVPGFVVDALSNMLLPQQSLVVGSMVENHIKNILYPRSMLLDSLRKIRAEGQQQQSSV